MAGVFLSYDRDDTSRARLVAAALERAGHSVWWDLHVRGGAQFAKVIEEALKAADAIIVLWSENSIESPWVRDEAAVGRDTARLVPVTIDGTTPPLGFRQFQTIDLSRWKGRGTPAALRTLFADVEALAPSDDESAAKTAAPEAPAGPLSRSATSHRRVAYTLIAALLFAFAGGLYWLNGRDRLRVPMVAVAAADNSPVSQSLARNLLVNLGTLQSARSGSMTLVNAVDGSSAPDLLFQAADTSEGGSVSATLALLSGTSHGLLWSKDFRQPSGKASDLKQQVAFTAGRVLDCALEGLSEHRLDAQILKTYLNACAQLSGIAGGDFRLVIPMFRQVTRDAPHFSAAWGKLLLAQASVSDLLSTNGTPDEQSRSDLRRLIAEARAINPGIAEADLAETVLLPATAYQQKLALIDRAARRSPDNPDVLSFRASVLTSVGRMRDAVTDARRASEIDQLSPTLGATYMAALAYAGLFDSASDQLAEIEKLWPGTSTAQDARFLFYFRYGDPKVALGMEQTQTGTAGVRYLIEARIDPTPANVDRLVDFLRARKDKFGEGAGAGRLAYYTLAMGGFHQHDELFDTLMHWGKPTDLALISGAYFRPELHEFRKEPGFLLVMDRAGLLDYWRTSGHWPDFCFEADMPYDCKAEAAKLK
ncbi:MAG TPA: TIR domain-containing protein [Sphingomicrobium sp.]|nr:TIR domain-containing protein [Sphingomicrobium sp.]